MSQPTFVIKSIILVPLLVAGAGFIGWMIGCAICFMAAMIGFDVDTRFFSFVPLGGFLIGVGLGIALTVKVAIEGRRSSGPPRRGFPVMDRHSNRRAKEG